MNVSTGYRKRVGVELASVATTVKAQNKVDLTAMAQAAGITEGAALDRLIEREIERRARRMEKHLDKNHLDIPECASSSDSYMTDSL